jgi:hypothetical protein
MTFKKMVRTQYPPRLWALVGFPGGGKSTFAAQMRGPLLPIDADQRFGEVRPLTASEVYQLSDVAADHTDAERVAALLAEGMPGSDVRTIIVDSLTTIIAPLVTRALIDNDAERNKNRMAAFREKALTMRLLQDSITKWGCDVLWIYHLQTGRDAGAKEQTTATVSKTELARLLRSLNLQLEIVQDGARRGVKVVWARRGRAYPAVPVLWDDSGKWAGMPEKIEAAVYDGLTLADQERIASATPTSFPNDEAAIAWGLAQGCFAALPHARNAYEKLKRAHPDANGDLASLWVADVQERVKGEGENAEGERGSGGAGEMPPPPTPEPAPEPPTDLPRGHLTANDFWQDFYRLKAEGRLGSQADKLKTAPEVKTALRSNDWATAHKWLMAQVR